VARSQLRDVSDESLPDHRCAVLIDTLAEELHALRHGPLQALDESESALVHVVVVDDEGQDHSPLIITGAVPDLADDLLLQVKRNVLTTNGSQVKFLSVQVGFELFSHASLVLSILLASADGDIESIQSINSTVDIVLLEASQSLLDLGQASSHVGVVSVVFLISLPGGASEPSSEVRKQDFVLMFGMFNENGVQNDELFAEELDTILVVKSFAELLNVVNNLFKGIVDHLGERDRSPLVMRHKGASSLDAGMDQVAQENSIGSAGNADGGNSHTPTEIRKGVSVVGSGHEGDSRGGEGITIVVHIKVVSEEVVVKHDQEEEHDTDGEGQVIPEQGLGIPHTTVQADSGKREDSRGSGHGEERGS